MFYVKLRLGWWGIQRVGFFSLFFFLRLAFIEGGDWPTWKRRRELPTMVIDRWNKRDSW